MGPDGRPARVRPGPSPGPWPAGLRGAEPIGMGERCGPLTRRPPVGRRDRDDRHADRVGRRNRQDRPPQPAVPWISSGSCSSRTTDDGSWCLRLTVWPACMTQTRASRSARRSASRAGRLAVGVSPDGRRLAVYDDMSTVFRMFDVERGERLLTIPYGNRNEADGPVVRRRRSVVERGPGRRGAHVSAPSVRRPVRRLQASLIAVPDRATDRRHRRY